MVDAWIPITLVAATIQAARTGVQKHLKAALKTNSVTFTRYGYGLPVALVLFGLLALFHDRPLPTPNADFLLKCLIGGVAQIAATSLLVWLFSFRNFAVGTTYSKTEVVQTAVLGIFLFGETLPPAALGGILISLAGVVLLSVVRSDLTFRGVLLGWTAKPALIGIASGTCFAVAALYVRHASLALGEPEALPRALTTLVWMTGMQAVLLGGWIAITDRGEFPRILRSWKTSGLAGLLSIVGSVAWFLALTLQTAAYVRALGQVELVLSLLASWLIFKERTTAIEIAGIAVLVGGIVVLVLAR